MDKHAQPHTTKTHHTDALKPTHTSKSHHSAAHDKPRHSGKKNVVAHGATRKGDPKPEDDVEAADTVDPKDPNFEDPADPASSAPEQKEDRKGSYGIRLRNVVESVTKDKLRELTGTYGTVVKAYFARRGPRGKSKETAFVYFDTLTSAENAIQGLNNKDVDGKKLEVEVAPPRPTRAIRRAREAEREAKEDRIPWDESKKFDSGGKELCLNFRNSNDCAYGDECKYSHEAGEPIGYPPRTRTRGGRKQPAKQTDGDEEVKVPAKTEADAAPKARKPRAKKVRFCRNWSEAESCDYGDECRFRHGDDDNRAIVQPKKPMMAPAPAATEQHEDADAHADNTAERGRFRGRGRGRGRGRRGRGRGRGGGGGAGAGGAPSNNTTGVQTHE